MHFVMDDSLGFIINKTAAKMKNYLHQSLKEYDITPEQWGILGRLWEQDGVSQKELSDKSCKDQANITRILDKLEEKGLITRQANPGDRRAFLIFLTEEGRKLKERVVPLVLKTLEKAQRDIGEEEIEHLKALLNKVYSNLE